MKDVLHWALLGVRLGVASVFVIAAAAKLADLARTRESLRKFGVPVFLTRVAAVLLPLAELAVAVVLVPTATARAGAIAALVLLAAFTTAIARAALRGDAADCNCFGVFASVRPGPALGRNALLAASAAAVALAGPGRGVAGPLGNLSTTAVLAAVFGVVIALQAWVSWLLLRQNGRLLERVRALEQVRDERPQSAASRLDVGAPAPAFALPDASGRLHTLDDLLVPGLPLALVFSDPDCAPCTSLPDYLAARQRALASELVIALVTRGVATPAPFAPVLIQDEHEVAHAYGAGHVPSALLIAPDGRIASPLAVGELEIKDLLAPRTLRAVS